MLSAIAFKTIYLPTNQGHGNARRISLNNASNELVALMDADDVSSSNRFERQLLLFSSHPELDICGGNITEFIGEESNIIARRMVEPLDNEIKRDLKKRCPMNQVTVMFKKSSYDLAGGYIDWYCEEDYYLWARMAQHNCVFGNVPNDIVNVRVGLEMSSRRGGWKYFKSEKRMQRYLLSNGIISLPRYLYNVLLRFGGEVILPNSLRNRAMKITREKYNPDSTEQETSEPIKVDCGPASFPPFSVAMCVYGKDNPEWFDRALESVLVKQSVKPAEIVLVVDGPIPDSIQTVIDKYAEICAGGA